MKNSNRYSKFTKYIYALTLIVATFLWIYVYKYDTVFLYRIIAGIIFIFCTWKIISLYHYKIKIQNQIDKVVNSLNDMAEGKFTDKYDNYDIVYTNKLGQAMNKLANKLSMKKSNNQWPWDNNFMASVNINEFIAHMSGIFVAYPKEDFSIIKFDIDKFEYINEIYGYGCGDKILQEVEDTLSNLINDDEIYIRNYDDNFLLLLHETNREEIIKKIDYISQKFKHIVDENGHKINIHFVFGIYIIEENTDEIEKMIDKANVAQKIAKLGYNTLEPYIFYNSKIKNKIIEEKKMESIMYYALGNNEFKVYLQGKKDLNNLEFSGAEALVRWDSSELGFISPIDFIPLFEKNGFIVEIDFYVFEEVCKNIRKWIDDGIDVKVTSINQSKRQLENDDYVFRLESIIKKYNIPPELIELEITETVVTSDVNNLIRVIDKLHKIGFKISIDDFGSGYSSLNMLKQINADVLKIDREFLNEANQSEKSKIIIKHVIKMAKELNMETITEGVENSYQEKFLRDIGCDMAQGYLYSKPMPIMEFEKKYYYKE